MTVRELIKALADMDMDANVIVEVEDGTGIAVTQLAPQPTRAGEVVIWIDPS